MDVVCIDEVFQCQQVDMLCLSPSNINSNLVNSFSSLYILSPGLTLRCSIIACTVCQHVIVLSTAIQFHEAINTWSLPTWQPACCKPNSRCFSPSFSIFTTWKISAKQESFLSTRFKWVGPSESGKPSIIILNISPYSKAIGMKKHVQHFGPEHHISTTSGRIVMAFGIYWIWYMNLWTYMNNYSPQRMILIYLGDYLLCSTTIRPKIPHALKKYQAKM